MTTRVTIQVSGNKACEVRVEGEGSVEAPVTVRPGSFAEKWIHGEQTITVKETGDFVS